MKPLVIVLSILFTLTFALPALADDDAPRIGLVLSGGGARGLAHIGVLRALEENHIKISAIAGTSMGAIIGALYASGRSPDEIEKIAREMDWARVFDDLPPRDRISYRRKQETRENQIKTQVAIENGVIRLPKGVVQGQNLQATLQQLFLHVGHIRNFDNLPIPFRAVAGDLVTGKPVVFSSGSLATVVRASMSIPGFFAPVEQGGKVLVDGGIANNLPVDVVKAMNVDYVIAVDITTPLYGPDELDSVVPIIEQLTTLLTYNQQQAQYALLGPDDLLVKPDLSDINTTEFDKTEIAIERGYEAIMSKSSRLAQFASRSATTPPRPGHFQPPVITGIEVDNETRVSDRLIRAQIRQAIGKRLDESQLRHDIDTIYGYEYFDSVFYDIIPGENGSVLRVSAREQSRSRNLLGISFELFSDTGTESGYNLGASFRKSDVTTRGGEWFTAAQVGQDPRIRTEFYLPLDFRQHYFLRPYIEYGERRFNQIAAENIDARFRINELLYGLFAGYEISNKAIAGFGYERHDGDIKSYVGSGPSGEFDDSLNYLLAEYDDVDSISFPHEGTLATLRYDFVDPSGAPRYNMFDARVLHAFPVGGQSIVFSGRYHRSGSLFVSRHLQPSLGGFGNLSGLHRDSLVGNNLTYVGVTWLHRLTERRLLPVDLPVYLALSIEAGNTWQDSADIDAGDLIYGGLLSLGVDTPFGPVYLGYGRAEIGNGTFYIRLGHLF